MQAEDVFRLAALPPAELRVLAETVSGTLLPDDAARAEFIDFYPWQYELDIHQSGISSVLPDGMRTPQLHHVGRPDADHLSLWWEFVPERAETWTLADYRLAARLLGQLAARRRAGAQVNEALPARCSPSDSTLASCWSASRTPARPARPRSPPSTRRSSLPTWPVWRPRTTRSTRRRSGPATWARWRRARRCARSRSRRSRMPCPASRR